ncbi:MAG: DivIVA domain-containing protein [Candidatus Nanopelagicales bacterium]
MTLTPQQVHDKQFNTVKMRTGYDMDEVDTFLDDVEAALGALIVDNDDLRAQLAQKPAAPVTPAEADKKLAEAQKQIAEADKKAADAQAKLTEAQAKLADAEKKAAEADRKLAEAAEREKAAETKLTEARRMATANTVSPSAPAAAAAAAMAAPPAPAAPAAPAPPPPAATTHAPARALALVALHPLLQGATVEAAKAEADTMLAKAREQVSKETSKLDEQRAALETKVNDLRSFERSYRTKLRDTISGQLAELDKVGSVEPKTGA